MATFKYAKLKGKIIEKFGTEGRFAAALGKNLNTVSRKLNGKVSFSSYDIEKWCSALDIPIEEAGSYFFT